MNSFIIVVISALAFASANEDMLRDAVRDLLSENAVAKRALTSALSAGAIMKAANGFSANLGRKGIIATPQSQGFIDSCLGQTNKPIVKPWGPIIGFPTFKPWGPFNPIVKGKREASVTLSNRDVVFVLDTSGSIPQDQFDKAKKSIVTLMEAYCPTEFGSKVKSTGTKQISVVLFDGRVTKEIDFSESSKGFGFLQDKIMSMKHRKGSTATANALKYVKDNILGKGASRLKNEQVATDVIVITDGQCNVNCGGLGNEANAIRKMGHGVNLFAMGVGRARACELEIITGDAKDVGIDLGNFSNLDSFAVALKALAAEKEKKCV